MKSKSSDLLLSHQKNIKFHGLTIRMSSTDPQTVVAYWACELLFFYFDVVNKF